MTHDPGGNAVLHIHVPEPNYAVELTPPDIEPYRAGNTGIDYVTTFDSRVAGPHVLVTARNLTSRPPFGMKSDSASCGLLST